MTTIYVILPLQEDIWTIYIERSEIFGSVYVDERAYLITAVRDSGWWFWEPKLGFQQSRRAMEKL